MLVGCYSLDLYCDTGDDAFGSKCPHRPILRNGQGEFTGPNERVCLQRARKAGWTFKEGATKAFCPACSKDMKVRRSA
jgi:hypothetical protein